ncbi:MAG: hypothetical protein WB441_04370, partial [Nocardioidaceae bacterium]
SDLVVRLAPRGRHPTLLAAISTGTSGGLVLVGLLAVLASASGSWRLVWAGTALTTAVAGVLNLRLVPRLSPRPRAGPGRRRPLPWRPLGAPVGFAVVYVAACTVYFTYAADAVAGAGLPAAAGPTLYALIGVSGLVALRTGTATRAVGPRRVAAACCVTVGTALVVLATWSGSWPAVLVSAAVFGVGYMTGAAVLAIWTAQRVPTDAAAAFTLALLVASVAGIAAPVVAGALVPLLGLPRLLLLAGLVTAAAGAGLALGPASADRDEHPARMDA